MRRDVKARSIARFLRSAAGAPTGGNGEPARQGIPPVRALAALFRRLHRDTRGVIAMEYMLILALVVLPIGLLFPKFISMIQIYGVRMVSLMGLPFP